MADDQIAAILKRAENIAINVTEEFRVSAFKVVFTLLANEAVPKTATPIGDAHKVDNHAESVEASAIHNTGQLSAISAWLVIDQENVAELIEFREEGANLRLEHLHSKLPVSKVARQQELTLIKLAIDRKAYGRKSVPVQELNKLFQDHDCYDTNVATNLRKLTNIRSDKDKSGSQYSILLSGIDDAKDRLLKLLAK